MYLSRCSDAMGICAARVIHSIIKYDFQRASNHNDTQRFKNGAEKWTINIHSIVILRFKRISALHVVRN